MSRAAFIEPCLPSPADHPPSGSNWIYEIKHDGYRLMARRDPVGIRLITRNRPLAACGLSQAEARLEDQRLPQSSSASRLTAGALGFLNLR